MKRGFLLFFALFFLIFSQEVFGQKVNWLKQRFKAGPIIGTNLTQVDGDTDAGIHKIGLHVGAGSYINLSDFMGLQLEILYAQKGAKFTQELYGAVGPYYNHYRMILNYLEIPLALKYYYRDDIHFGAGVSFNRLINSKEDYTTLYGIQVFDSDQYYFEKNSWDAFISIDYQVFGRLIAELRYQYSITPIRYLNQIPQGFSNGRDQVNNLFVVRLGYYL
ncbi:MAG TPA: porin family protein [Edaphocola sp.]|nr:porin family protein [Edaphocola sp.]